MGWAVAHWPTAPQIMVNMIAEAAPIKPSKSVGARQDLELNHIYLPSG